MEHVRQAYDTEYDQFARPQMPVEKKLIYDWYRMAWREVTVLHPAPRAQDMPHHPPPPQPKPSSTVEEATELITRWLQVHHRGTVADIVRGCKLSETIVRKALLSNESFALEPKTGSRSVVQVWGLQE